MGSPAPPPELDDRITNPPYAMKVSCLLLLLTANVALATKWPSSCCAKFTLSGFSFNWDTMFINGDYHLDDGKDYYMNMNGMKILTQSGYWEIYDQGVLVYRTAEPVAASCPEDLPGLKELEFSSMVNPPKNSETGSFSQISRCPAPRATTTAEPTTTTAAPTTTSNPCPSCRKVAAGNGLLSGVYRNTASGDGRCTMDGCLYEKDGESYCFQVGSYQVEETCSP